MPKQGIFSFAAQINGQEDEQAEGEASAQNVGMVRESIGAEEAGRPIRDYAHARPGWVEQIFTERLYSYRALKNGLWNRDNRLQDSLQPRRERDTKN